MVWRIPPRRYPHGSYSQIYAVPELGQEDLDPATKKFMDHFERSLSAGLDFMQEQLAVVFLGVSLINERGQLTLADANTTVTVTFAEEEVDTNYSVFLSTSGFNGAPAAGAFAVKSITKTTTGFIAGFITAPGGGTNVVYDWILVREITR